MKPLLFLLLPVLFFLSCKRGFVGEQQLEGTWKMVKVLENNTGRLHFPPSNSKDLQISFQSTTATTGALSGFTPTNEIFPSNYTQTAERTLSIPALNRTKVAENPWGA